MRAFNMLFLIGILQFMGWTTIASTALAITSSQAQPSSTGYSHSSVAETSKIGITDASAAATLGALYRKSRQSRCVRCYEDRHGDDRSRIYPSYPARSADDRSNWYYPNDRYDDRYRSGDRDYDRYYYEYYRYNRDRDDRYIPRSYDRYEGRGYDRYDDRRGSYDRGESRGYGYDNRDRYIGADRYSDYYSASKGSDRYYDRPRIGSVPPAYGYDRDTYDRYYPRGESGFDSAGRGYYFATSSGSRYGADTGRDTYAQDQNSYYRPSTGGSSYLPQAHRPETTPCGVQVPNCPHAGSSGSGYTSTATSQPIYSGSHNGSGTQIITTNKDGSNKGWKYVHDIDTSNGGDRGNLDRDRDRNQQSSPYGGRPARPLGGSYLLDRDSNVVSEAGTSAGGTDGKMTQEDVVNMVGGGSQDTPEPAALTSLKQQSNQEN